MALSIRQSAPASGVQWMRDAFRLFMRRPLPFAGMFVSFLLLALLATLVPLVGGIVMLMALPLLTLGFMLASRAALDDLPVHPGLFIEPLRGDAGTRRALLTLCMSYAVATVLIMSLSEWIDGGSFERLQQLMAKGDEGRAEMEAILADPSFTWGLVTRFGLAGLLSVPFWHAPALVYWQRQGVGQALFEHGVYDESGQLLSGSFMDYCMPRADNLPNLVIEPHSTTCAHTPMGVKGCGECGTIGSPAAVISAVVDALKPLGVTHVDMPATPNRIWRIISEAKRQMAAE